MQYVEYGSEHRDTVILLHGGGLCPWNYREAAERLAAGYRVILPILDGHAGSDAPFTTIADNAARIVRYIDEALGGQVLLLGGLSLGAQILLEILSMRPHVCRYAWIESAAVIPSRLTHAMIRPAFGSCYGLIQKRWFAHLQSRALHIPHRLFEDYFRDTAAVAKADMISFLEANALYEAQPSLCECTAKGRIVVGKRERAMMHKSARRVHSLMPNSDLCILPDAYHGTFAMSNPEGYVRALENFIREG